MELHYCTKRIIEYSKTACFNKLKEPMNCFIKELFEDVFYSDECIEYSDVIEIEWRSFDKGFEILKSYSDTDLPKAFIERGVTKDDLVRFFEEVREHSDPDNYLITLEWF